jgi:hypothetical protein
MRRRRHARENPLSSGQKWLLIGGGVVAVGVVGYFVWKSQQPAAAPAAATTNAVAPTPTPAALPTMVQAREAQQAAQTAANQAAQVAQQTAAQQAAQQAAAQAAAANAWQSQPSPQPTPAPAGVTYALTLNSDKSVQLNVGQTLGIQFMPSSCGSAWSIGSTATGTAAHPTGEPVDTPAYNIIRATAVGTATVSYTCGSIRYNVTVGVNNPGAVVLGP